ncbi:MarR family transcriptional regulator [Streptacidiphilus sp. EB129]|uniref:MarR family transcriptional regulator n=1 Tax=Streptacidiphilus sp. EB129 TaxID=3156262 RepID=UPI00351635E3
MTAISPTEVPPPVRPGATAPIVQMLARCPDRHLSGVLQVAGDPGGALHLTDGRITAVDTPGAPDAATLLLASGRIGEAEWAAAFSADAFGIDTMTGPARSPLVSSALVGAAELQLVCLMAVLDGAFAVAAGRIDTCSLEGSAVAHVLPAAPGIEPERLMRETERRLRALASRQEPLCPYRDRVLPADRAGRLPVESLGDDRREILAHVDGRRSCRDIAFLIGRGVYTVTMETSRMLSEGLAVLRPRGAEPRDTEPPGAPPHDADPHSAEPRDTEPRDAEPCDAEPCGGELVPLPPFVAVSSGS